jgi:hypothetical protein
MGKQSKAKAATATGNHKTKRDEDTANSGISPSSSNVQRPRQDLSGPQMTAFAFLTVAISGIWQTTKGDSYFHESQQPQSEENLALLQLYSTVGKWCTSWSLMSVLLLWHTPKTLLQTYNIICAISPVSTTYLFHLLDPSALPYSQNMHIALLAAVSFSASCGYAPLTKVSLWNVYDLVLFTLSNCAMALVSAVVIFGKVPNSMEQLDNIGIALWLKTFAVHGTSMVLTTMFAMFWMDPIRKRLLLLFMAATTVWFANSCSSKLPVWITQYDNTFYNILLGSTMIMSLGGLNPNLLGHRKKQQ